ncbi:MAG: hypothetical protein WCO64_07775, partial [Actinomycetes bacterium]
MKYSVKPKGAPWLLVAVGMLIFLLISAGETTHKVLPGITPVPTSTLWILPIARLFCDLASVAVVGGFLVGGFLIPYGRSASLNQIGPFINWS